MARKRVFSWQKHRREVESLLAHLREIFFITTVNGDITWGNTAFLERFPQGTDMNLPDLAHIESREVLRQVLAEGVVCRHEIWLGVTESFTPFELDVYPSEDGVFFYVFGRDMTQKHNIVEERIQLTSVVEASLDAIYAIDTDGRILSWNKAAVQIFGFEREEAVGQSIRILALEGQEEEMDAIIQIIRQGASYGYETVRQRKNKALVSLFVTVAPMRDSRGILVGSSAVARDITDMQKQKSEMAKLDRLNTFAELASVISHEVRNPMTTISGFLQMLRKKAKDQKQLEYFAIIAEEIARINDILSEFITIGKSKEVKQERLDLNQVLRAMAPLLEADAAYQGKIIKVSHKGTAFVWVNGNEIRQLLLNLSRNGLEAMEPNGILQIRTSVKDRKVILSVKDQGHGIKEEDMEKIGTAFFSTKETGTGLGLYVCYEIVHRHKASLNIITGDKGTTFIVTFNAAEEREDHDESGSDRSGSRRL
jgi:PAS domain S-box-containing protein